MACPELKQEPKCPQSTEAASKPLELSFYTLSPSLPREVIDIVLEHWIDTQYLLVSYPSLSSGVVHVTYSCATDSAANSSTTLPTTLQVEYWRRRQLSWLTEQKLFLDPHDYYMSHYLLSLDHHAKLPSFSRLPRSFSQLDDGITINLQPLLLQPHSPLSQHGLERVELVFDASQYFAFFDVILPPFHPNIANAQGDISHHDPNLHGAASFLQHTTHLVLHFGPKYKWAHPWFNIRGSAWDDARCRPRVCESGLIIDWILEYAWNGKYLQHLEGFEVRGDIQGWVKRKWENIFAKQREHVEARRQGGDLIIDPFAVHEPDIVAIEFYGMRDGKGMNWRAEEHFPPKCKCEMGCWRLDDGKVLEELEDRAWEEEEDGLRGDWYL